MTLTDGIFAIAMTLLVLSIEVPKKEAVTAGAALHQYLLALYPQFFNYFLSFYLLSRLWINLHRVYHDIIRTDDRHIWINISLLMFVVLVPFSASLDAEYSGDFSAVAIFHANMLVIAVLYFWNWSYAARNHRLIEADFPDAVITLMKKRMLVFPVTALLALLISIMTPSYSTLTYLFIPFCVVRLRNIQNSLR